MTVSPQELMQPLVWQRPQLAALLRDLQANILKSHGRDHVRLVGLSWHPARRNDMRAALAAVPVTEALTQLQAAQAQRLHGADGGPMTLLMLSANGYAALGVAPARTPGDPAFRAGMTARAAALGDDVAADWEAGYREPLLALLLVADSNAGFADAAMAARLAPLLAAGANVVVRETGTGRIKGGQHVEHFGYVDGRSQPLMLDEEVVRELNNQGERFVWNPAFGPLEVALVRDPGGAGADSYGAYLVFRKLEQNVARFKAGEEKLADALQLMGDEARELAGAMIVGRFEDGTPVLTSKRALGAAHVANNFAYGGDPAGNRCPVQAHIRKTNPRGETGDPAERLRLMPRRGITYGDRAADMSDRPESGVGLLFMAYNQDIGRQFEFTQRSWANNANFLRPQTGIDPVIGQGARQDYRWPASWDHAEAGSIAHPFEAAVTSRGGEYFFAPSLGFLRGLATRAD